MSPSGWAIQGTDANILRKIMSHVSLWVRLRQYAQFVNIIGPTAVHKILDVGPTSDATLSDSNFFEKVYPHPGKLSLASIEDCRELVSKFHLAGYTPIAAGKKLPFRARSFDIVVSWATLEHVGSRSQQKMFLSEISRVGRRFFVTTPDRASPYEPHTATMFLHWLPAGVFRRLAKLIGKSYWSSEQSLNIISYSDALEMAGGLPGVKVRRFRAAGLIPSNLIIFR